MLARYIRIVIKSANKWRPTVLRLKYLRTLEAENTVLDNVYNAEVGESTSNVIRYGNRYDVSSGLLSETSKVSTLSYLKRVTDYSLCTQKTFNSSRVDSIDILGVTCIGWIGREYRVVDYINPLKQLACFPRVEHRPLTSSQSAVSLH